MSLRDFFQGIRAVYRALTKKDQKDDRKRITEVLVRHNLEWFMEEDCLKKLGFSYDMIACQHSFGTGAGIPGTEVFGYKRDFREEGTIAYIKERENKYCLHSFRP